MESEDSEKEDILLLQIGVLMTLNKKIKSKKRNHWAHQICHKREENGAQKMKLGDREYYFRKD